MHNSILSLIEVLPTYNYREQAIVTIMNMLSFYKTNPRSIHEGKSYYKHPTNGSSSPVGLFILDDKYTEDIEPKFIGQIKDILHPAIHPLVDLGDMLYIERLHDMDVYWNGSELSQTGLNWLGNIFGFNTQELFNVLSVYKKTEV